MIYETEASVQSTRMQQFNETGHKNRFEKLCASF